MYGLILQQQLSTMELKINKGVPVPPEKKRTKYPFKDMVVGDSFELRYKKPVYAAIYTAVSIFKKNNPKTNFRIETNFGKTKITVWKVK